MTSVLDFFRNKKNKRNQPCVRLPASVKDNNLGLKAISHKDKYHDPERTLTYSFLGGTDSDKSHTRKGIKKILDVVPGLKLVEVPYRGDIRISFDPALGSWSYLGTDIFIIPKNEPTMNLGWREKDHNVVIHEFCHALNMSHEHLRGVNWDKEKVYKYFADRGWSKSMVDNNLFNFQEAKYDVTDFDSESIMLYSLPCNLTKDGKNCGKRNTKLSKGDIKRLNEMFPSSSEEERRIKELSISLKRIFYIKSQLKRIYEKQLVVMAAELGMEASTKDRKNDTINRIWEKINSY
jgi:serralysin